MSAKPLLSRPAPVKAARRRSARPGDPEFYSGDAYPMLDSVGYLVKRLRTHLERALDSEMAELDLTDVQWGPLLLLHHGMGNTAAEFARVMNADTGAMTRLLDRLEAKGLVRRVPSAQDRRVVELALTPEGTRLCRDIPYGLARVMNATLKGFSATEVETLKTLLRRMLANAERL
jgi:DNA-binding MarR family transcriptional regulator